MENAEVRMRAAESLAAAGGLCAGSADLCKVERCYNRWINGKTFKCFKCY